MNKLYKANNVITRDLSVIAVPMLANVSLLIFLSKASLAISVWNFLTFLSGSFIKIGEIIYVPCCSSTVSIIILAPLHLLNHSLQRKADLHVW